MFCSQTPSASFLPVSPPRPYTPLLLTDTCHMPSNYFKKKEKTKRKKKKEKTKHVVIV